MINKINYIILILLTILINFPLFLDANEEVDTLLKKDIKILFLGDSLTEGFGVESEEAFPSLLDSMLKQKGYNNIKIINAGISGSTTASAVSRLKWYLKSKPEMRPEILFLALGANDGLRGLSLKAMEQNLNGAIEIAVSSGMKVILAGMEIPPNYGVEYTNNFRDVFKTLADKHKIAFMPYLLKDVGGFVNLNLPDGVHPNADGYKIVAGNVLPYILDKL
ncbi:MAG: arylesterase [Desulfamplus sp.]|nr:arylesterase [Desulfamplus sp.]